MLPCDDPQGQGACSGVAGLDIDDLAIARGVRGL